MTDRNNMTKQNFIIRRQNQLMQSQVLEAGTTINDLHQKLAEITEIGVKFQVHICEQCPNAPGDETCQGTLDCIVHTAVAGEGNTVKNGENNENDS